MPIVVRPATRYDRASIAAALGRAFEDDPVMQHVLGRRVAVGHAMERMFAVIVGHFLRAGEGWTTEEHDGASLWGVPGHWKPDASEGARMAGPMARIVGLGGITHLRGYAALEHLHGVLAPEPHYYLGVLGTEPSRQGKGVGAALLEPVLERCDALGLPAYLESSKERNLPFYGRFGFRVCEEHRFGKVGPPVWPMLRDPRSPGG